MLVSIRLKESTQLNESVYHDIIPGIETLDPVLPVELVKPVVFKPTDPSSVGTDILQRLVPMRAYEAASVYRYTHYDLAVVQSYIGQWQQLLAIVYTA